MWPIFEPSADNEYPDLAKDDSDNAGSKGTSAAAAAAEAVEEFQS